mgnify:CR=1 FL=1
MQFNSIYIVSKSVSYTHLRAHETVLDLVCRLLLEKKKNTTTYIDIILNNIQLNRLETTTVEYD